MIIGPYLVRSIEEDCWKADVRDSYDKVVMRSDDIEHHFSSPHRVLVTRRTKGIFVTFTNEATKKCFVESLKGKDAESS